MSEYWKLTPEQYEEIDSAGNVPQPCLDAGWHFCCELDYALVNRNDLGMDFCECYSEEDAKKAEGDE